MWELRPLIRAKNKKAKEADKRLREQLDKFILSIRDFNNSIDIEIASFLEPDHQQEFLMMVTIRDFPDLFIQSPVDINTKRLETYDGLTDEQRSVIRVLYSDYKVKRFTDRQQMIFDLRHWNSQKQTDRRFARLDEYLKEGLTYNEAVKIFAREHVSIPHLWRLYEHERQVCEAIRSIFSLEQFNELPAEVRLYLSLWN